MVVIAHPPEHLLAAEIEAEKFDLGIELELGPDLVEDSKCFDLNKFVLEKTEIPAFKAVKIPCKGYGMIATRKLYPGDLILAEEPVLIVPDAIFEDVEQCEEFLEKEMNMLSSTKRELVLSLTDKREVEEDSSYDPNPYCGIFYTNAMTYGDDAALCPVMARANHSCRPNAEFISRADLGEQHLVTNYVINKGEEITINYMSMAEEGSDTKETRQSYLRRDYGFQCTCKACTLEGQELLDDESVRESMKELQAAGEDNLDAAEIESLIWKAYHIQGKHSYILELFHILYRSAPVGSYRMVEYAVNGFTIAVNLYGIGSKEAREWKNQLDFQKSVNVMILLDENLPESHF